jgi:hypothetical protein
LAVRLAKQARDSYCERKKQEHVSRGQSWWYSTRFSPSL